VPDMQISHNADRARYEARVGSKVAGFADYQLAKDLIVFTHTEVDPAFEGQGVGSALARAALDDVRGTGRKVLPLCPFIKGWIAGHREYVDLVYGAPPSTVID
jgi:predicted GNAT family acetyltransferase